MKELQGLTVMRGIAAMWVVLFHYNHHFSADLGWLVRQGDLAVDLFFVLSGFVMIYAYRNGVSLPEFIYRRIARIYPVHATTMAAVMAMTFVATVIGISPEGTVTTRDTVAHMLMVHAWGFTDGLSLNYPSWSISAEFFAYLAFPLLFILVSRKPLLPCILAALAFLGICAYIADLTGRPITERTYDFSIIRIMPEFILGLVAGRFFMAGKRALPVILVYLFCSLVIVSAFPRLSFVLAMPPLMVVMSKSNLNFPKFFVWMGKISFSIYMVHALVEKVFFSVAELVTGERYAELYLLPIVLTLTIFCGWAMRELIEEPAQRFLRSIMFRMQTPSG